MARTQSFDRDHVIRSARTLFWTVGFESAGISELEQATGIRRSSIYHAFGSKRGLFDAAVQSYLDEVVRPLLSGLTSPEVPPRALPDYLTILRERFARLDPTAGTSGCLLINTAGAPIAEDPAVASVIADYRQELGSAFSRGVTALAPDLEERAAATLSQSVTALVVSAFALARVDRSQAIAGLETALSLVEVAAPQGTGPTSTAPSIS